MPIPLYGFASCVLLLESWKRDLCESDQYRISTDTIKLRWKINVPYKEWVKNGDALFQNLGSKAGELIPEEE